MLPLHPVVVALLRPHKAAQAAERLRAGDQWAGTNNLVFMTELGRPADPRNLLRVVAAAAAKDGQRRWDGWRPAFTSRRWPTCSGTAASR